MAGIPGELLTEVGNPPFALDAVAVPDRVQEEIVGAVATWKLLRQAHEATVVAAVRRLQPEEGAVPAVDAVRKLAGGYLGGIADNLVDWALTQTDVRDKLLGSTPDWTIRYGASEAYGQLRYVLGAHLDCGRVAVADAIRCTAESLQYTGAAAYHPDDRAAVLAQAAIFAGEDGKDACHDLADARIDVTASLVSAMSDPETAAAAAQFLGSRDEYAAFTFGEDARPARARGLRSGPAFTHLVQGVRSLTRNVDTRYTTPLDNYRLGAYGLVAVASSLVVLANQPRRSRRRRQAAS